MRHKKIMQEGETVSTFKPLKPYAKSSGRGQDTNTGTTDMCFFQRKKKADKNMTI